MAEGLLKSATLPVWKSIGLAQRVQWRQFGGVLAIFVASRLAFYAIALTSTAMLPRAPAWDGQVEVTRQGWLALFWRWDAIYYYSVALGGYAPTAGSVPIGDVRSLPAFFPLFPLLTRGLALVLAGAQGHSSAAWLALSGVLAAQAAALLAAWFLFQLAREESGDAGVAQRSVLYMTIFPLAFFYAAPYAEALFLATSIGVFLAARRQQWLSAGLWAAAAAATRPFGILLLPVLALEIVLAWRRGNEMRWWRAMLGLLIAPSGLLLFMLYLWQQVGDPLAFIHAQTLVWGRSAVFPLLTLWRGVRLVLQPSLSPNADAYAQSVLHTAIVIGFLLVMLVSVRRWRPSYLLYGALLFVQVLAVPWPPEIIMHTLGRAVMVLFPVYFTLAQWGRRVVVHHTIVLVWLPLWGLLAALYVCWYFVA